MTYSDLYEKIYIAYLKKVPLSYIAITKDQYVNLKDYIPVDNSIENLKQSLDIVMPLLKSVWLLTPNNYISEYFRNVDLSDSDIDKINKIAYNKYIDNKMIRKDFNKILRALDENSNEVKFISSIFKYYQKEKYKFTSGITYYSNILEKPTVQDFATSLYMPIVINKDLVVSDKDEDKKKKEYIITDIKAETDFTNSKFINYFFDKTKQGWNMMLLPTSDFSVFKKIKCQIKKPMTQKENYKLLVTTTNALWDECRSIIDKHVKLNYTPFRVYSKKYILRIEGSIDQNSFYHFLMTNLNLFDSIVPIDSIKVLKSNQRSYVRFVSRTSTIGSAVIYNENYMIYINYISYVDSYRDAFYIQFLISVINFYKQYEQSILTMYKDFFNVSYVSEKKKSTSSKTTLTNKSCQSSNAPVILPFTQDNVNLAFSTKKSYGFLTKEHLKNAYSSVNISEDYILLQCGIDENGNPTKYKYFGIGQSQDKKIYACCYEKENVYVTKNATIYKQTKDIIQTYKSTYRIITGNKNLKNDEIAYINDPYRSFLKKVISFNEDTFEVYRKSYIIKNENNLVELITSLTDTEYREAVTYINNHLHKISQNIIDTEVHDYSKIEYLHILEEFLNMNIYVFSKEGLEVGNYNNFYLKAFKNRRCMIIYKNVSEKDLKTDKSTTSYEIIGLGDKDESTKKKLRFVYDLDVNYNMYKALLLSTNVEVLEGSLNYSDMDMIFKNVANYQIIDDDGKTIGIVISKNNKLFNFDKDKIIFFDPSPNMNIPIYPTKVKNAMPDNLIEYKKISDINKEITKNLNEYMSIFSNFFAYTFSIYEKDIDNDENIIGVFYNIEITKNNRKQEFDIIKGNNQLKLYYPIYPLNKIPLFDSLVRVNSSKSIYRLPYHYEFKNDVIVQNEDPMVKNIIINEIYNNFITFIVNIATDQDISLFDFSNNILYEKYDLPIEVFYETFLNYKKVQEKIPNIFLEENDKLYIKLPEPYFSHVVQYLKNPRSTILNKSFSDISDLLRIIQLSDPVNYDIINKRKVSKNIVDIIEPYYLIYQNNLYLTQKINESSIFRLSNILSAWNTIKINLGYNCTENYDFKNILNIIDNYELTIGYYNTNGNIITTIENRGKNILFFDTVSISNQSNKDILQKVSEFTDMYILLKL